MSPNSCQSLTYKPIIKLVANKVNYCVFFIYGFNRSVVAVQLRSQKSQYIEIIMQNNPAWTLGRREVLSLAAPVLHHSVSSAFHPIPVLSLSGRTCHTPVHCVSAENTQLQYMHCVAGTPLKKNKIKIKGSRLNKAHLKTQLTGGQEHPNHLQWRSDLIMWRGNASAV